ncbi:MAG: hypothetical protein QM582_14005 [Micropruina sp.]|uniref:hypothetical protein n=1 Tax=Micropruina sp. TaxID=2737536 RepID=UPI0039E4FAF2
MSNPMPKPGPSQSVSLAQLAEKHARWASDLITRAAMDDDPVRSEQRVKLAEGHAAIARACAHAAHANRPVHTARVVKL